MLRNPNLTVENESMPGDDDEDESEILVEESEDDDEPIERDQLTEWTMNQLIALSRTSAFSARLADNRL